MTKDEVMNGQYFRELLNIEMPTLDHDTSGQADHDRNVVNPIRLNSL